MKYKEVLPGMVFTWKDYTFQHVAIVCSVQFEDGKVVIGYMQSLFDIETRKMQSQSFKTREHDPNHLMWRRELLT